MIVGTDGNCIETCGDGLRFQLTGCDDGNTKDGDGCSSDCLPEPGYMCHGGSSTSKDTCYYLRTEIVGAKVNDYNDILLNFSRPIYFKKGYIDSSDLKLFYRSESG